MITTDQQAALREFARTRTDQRLCQLEAFAVPAALDHVHAARAIEAATDAVLRAFGVAAPAGAAR